MRNRTYTRRLGLEPLEQRLALAVAVWDGGSLDSNRWSEEFNWVGDVAPIPDDDLVFPAMADQFTAENDFPAETSFHSITLEASYELSGNAITLQSDSGGVDAPLPAYLEATAGISSIGFDIFVPPNPTVPPNPVVPPNPIRVAVGSELALAGVVSGGAALEKLGAGTLILSAANTFGGEMTVAEGTLSVRNDGALGANAGGTELSAGTTLELFGGVAIANEPLLLNAAPVDPCHFTSLGGNNFWGGSVSAPTDPCRFVLFTNLELAGAIGGAGDIQKLGGATLVLSGDSPDYTGTIQVFEGTVQLDGAMPNASVELAGGLLTGAAPIGDLTVHGTPAHDRIRIENAPQPGAVEVLVNGMSQGSFALTERLIVRAGAGNDIVEAADSVGLSVWLYGDSGHDLLKGGSGHDVLVGGDGFDALFGGGGRDLILGGRDSDLVVAGAGDDLVIAGTTAFDDQDAALLAILAEWTSSRNYQTRVANLRGTGSGASFANRLNSNFFLKTDTPLRTVFDDSAIDVLSGNSGRDWFFANTDGTNRDQFTDRAPNELVDDVDT